MPLPDGFIESYTGAWNGRDSAAIEALVTEDVVWEDPAMPAPAIGPAAVRAFMEQSWAAFPDLVFDEPEPRLLFVDGDQVSWRWRMRGTMRGAIDPPGFGATNRAMEVVGVDLWGFRGDRIATYRAFYDMNQLAVQLGIAPAPGSGGERAMAALQRVQARVLRKRAG